jgi:hypothetical protein
MVNQAATPGGGRGCDHTTIPALPEPDSSLTLHQSQSQPKSDFFGQGELTGEPETGTG